MHCPYCGADDTKVIDSRLSAEGDSIRRRRKCTECEARFTTYETAELAMPRIIKQDNTRQVFDEDKLRGGFIKATQKCPVSIETIDGAISRIKRKLQSYTEREVPSRVLGSWVMTELAKIDPVAYVRFASVYHSFKDLDAFREEIERLENPQGRITEIVE